MKLEKVLDKLNSLEKGAFIKLINSFLSAGCNSKEEVEEILADKDGNLKNADSVQLALVYNLVSDKYAKFIREEYTKSTSQLDILLELITRDGNCIMRTEWFAKLYDDEIKKQKNAIRSFQEDLESDKPSVGEDRVRDYKVFKACLDVAYHNDEQQNFDPKISTDEQTILDTLARQLGLSQDEVSMIKYSVLGIPKLGIDEVIAELKDKGIIFLSRKTNTIYVADEIVSLLRRIKGKEVADKFFRRTLLQLKEAQVNQICRKHGINPKEPSLQQKIEEIIASGVSYSSVLKDEIYKNDAKLSEKKRLLAEFVEEKLAIPGIKGLTIDDKVANLIEYFENLYNDERLGISAAGYERLAHDLGEFVPEANKIIRKTFQLQEENVMNGACLTEYNIMPRDILELLDPAHLSMLCQERGIKTRGNIIDNILAAYKDSENLFVENFELIGKRDLNALKTNGIIVKEAELGVKFEEVTKYILENIGFDVNERLRKKINTEKDKVDILVSIDDSSVLLIECKTVKDSGYNKFSSISRQIRSYKTLIENKGLRVAKILVVAPDFSDDFISDCGDDFDLNISLVKASSLVAIYKACKDSAGKKVTAQMLMKDVLVQEDRIIRALRK
ncbi:MAG: hypothetical protein IJY44_04075 [Bacteroidaceae bacterium]|nr:hypothetical protein [Bacteroidaceae bacterium]